MAEDESKSKDGPSNPLEELLRQMGLLRPDGSVPDLAELMSQAQQQLGGFASPLQAMFAGSPQGAALPAELVRDAARKTTALAGADPTPSDGERRDVREAVELAQQWLAEHTTFDPLEARPAAWSRAEWVEEMLPGWVGMAEPVVAHLTDAMQGLFGPAEGVVDPQALEILQPMLRRSAGAMLGAQLGQALGEMSAGVLTGTEVIVPVIQGRPTALLSANVAAFAAELDLPARDARLHLALRESARNRLFAAVSWLGPQLQALIAHYAREITIDRAALEDAFGQAMAPASAQELEELLTTINGTLFEPATSPEQREVLARVETLVALVEGWVDDVVEQAGSPWLPNFEQLAEATRRRLALGGPAGVALKRVLGLELRPRLIREAGTLWAALRDGRGVAGRDDVWRHPDLMPTARDLADPLGYVRGETSGAEDAMDRELAEMLDDEAGEE